MYALGLKQEIVRLRIENILLRAKAAGIRKDLDIFVKNYLSSVSDLCEELSNIETQIRGYDDKMRPSFRNPTEAEAAATESVYDSELKRIYRKLIKLVHPDLSRGKPRAQEYTRIVNDAYTARNLAQLIKLDEELDMNRPEELLQRTYNALVTANYNLKNDIDDIKNEPAYQLKEGFHDVDNDSILSGIRLKLKRRIDHENRRLLAKKLDYLEEMHKRIVA